MVLGNAHNICLILNYGAIMTIVVAFLESKNRKAKYTRVKNEIFKKQV